MITRFLPEAFVDALGWTLLHSLWQIAIFALAGAVILILMRRFSAVARYRMLASIMALFLVSSFFTFAQVYSPQTEQVILADRSNELEFQGADISEHQTLNSQDVSSEAGSFLSSLRGKAAAYFSQHLPLTVSLWLLGVFVFLLKLLGQLAFVQRLKSYGVDQIPDSWNDLIKEAETKMQVKRKVKYLGSRLADSPMTVGWWQPYILFPIELMTGLTDKEIRSILAHELAHIKRNDYAMNIVQSLVGILYFYHPGSWWLSHRIDEEREHCCDDLALEMGTNPKHYAKTIIHLKEIQMNNFALAQNIQGPPSQTAFGHRALRLLQSPLRAANYREGFLTAMLLVFGLFTAVQAANFTNPALQSEQTEDNSLVADRDDQFGEGDSEFGESTAQFGFDGDTFENSESKFSSKEADEPKDELELLLEAIDEGNMKLVKYFLDQGIDLNRETDKGWTPLMVAASEDQPEIAKLLIDRGAEIDYVNKKGWTALVEAADEGSTSVARLLIDLGANVDLTGPETNRNAVVMAASEGNLGILKMLLKAGAKMTSPRGELPMLHAAAEEGEFDIVRFLVGEGADVNATDDEGRTPLSYAAEEDNKDVIDYLLGQGANPDIEDDSGNSSLVYAAEENNPLALDRLLSESSDRDNPMILFAAVNEGNTSIVKGLIDAGYDVDQRFENNRTPLMLASGEEENALIKLLLDEGAKIGLKDDKGRTALHYAAREDDHRSIKTLVTAGADLEAKIDQEYTNWDDRDGHMSRFFDMTPLLSSVEEESISVTRALLESGANVNARSDRKRWDYTKAFMKVLSNTDWDDLDFDAALDTDGGNLELRLDEQDWTPLMEATLSGKTQMVLLLMEFGADRKLQTKSGMTAVDVARKFGHRNLESILK